jgi:hypothetical protein
MLFINSTNLQDYTKKLEKLHKSALPVAIRETLNDCAKDMKTKSLIKFSSSEFINRTSNFFKANSSFERAEGFNIESMKAVVGMTDNNLKGSDNYAVKDLVQQESGGNINKRSFIPMKDARVSSNPNKLVRAVNRLKSIRTIVKESSIKGSNSKQKFVKSVYMADKGGFVLTDIGSKETLFRVNSVNNTKDKKFKLTALYSFQKNRSVRVPAHHFIEKSGNMSHKKIDEFYIERAERAFRKYLS